MEAPAENPIVHREIGFCTLGPDPRPAHGAALLLSDVEGVVGARPVADHRLTLSYDLRQVYLELLESFLGAEGFHLDNSIMAKLRRALYYYADEVRRANLGCNRGSSNCTDKIFVHRYQRQPHGCRDARPEHWRQYL